MVRWWRQQYCCTRVSQEFGFYLCLKRRRGREEEKRVMMKDRLLEIPRIGRALSSALMSEDRVVFASGARSSLPSCWSNGRASWAASLVMKSVIWVSVDMNRADLLTFYSYRWKLNRTLLPENFWVTDGESAEHICIFPKQREEKVSTPISLNNFFTGKI